MMGLPDGPKSFPIGLVVLIQYRLWQTPSHVAVAITLNALAKAPSLKLCKSVLLNKILKYFKPFTYWQVTSQHISDKSAFLSAAGCVYIWRAPWKNRISSTSMILRKSLIKPVTWQNISSCSVLSPEIVVRDAFNVILWTSANICVVMHDDLRWKNRTTRYILCRVTGFASDFHPPQMSADICVGHDDLWWKNRATRCNMFWRAGCSRLEYVDIRLVY